MNRKESKRKKNNANINNDMNNKQVFLNASHNLQVFLLTSRGASLPRVALRSKNTRIPVLLCVCVLLPSRHTDLTCLPSTLTKNVPYRSGNFASPREAHSTGARGGNSGCPCPCPRRWLNHAFVQLVHISGRLRVKIDSDADTDDNDFGEL